MRNRRTAADMAASAGPGRIEVRTLDLPDRSTMAALVSDIVAPRVSREHAGYGVIGGMERVGAARALRDPTRTAELRDLLRALR